MSILFISKHLFESNNHIKSLVIDGLHLCVGVARGETGHVDILQHLQDALLPVGRHLFIFETLSYSVSAEPGELDAVLVRQAPPRRRHWNLLP